MTCGWCFALRVVVDNGTNHSIYTCSRQFPNVVLDNLLDAGKPGEAGPRLSAAKRPLRPLSPLVTIVSLYRQQ